MKLHSKPYGLDKYHDMLYLYIMKVSIKDIGSRVRRASVVGLLLLSACAPAGYHYRYMALTPNRKMPSISDVVGTGTARLGKDSTQVVYVQVPGQDVTAFGIKCDYTEMHGGTKTASGEPISWPDGPAIWDKYCKS